MILVRYRAVTEHVYKDEDADNSHRVLLREDKSVSKRIVNVKAD